ncbi:hypothetical protein EDC56_1510 [Sinobacterium caligoides]|uniref:Uncharacterized protein n=1 Tax=Sinobacterium caligoides TaxID=933926 RepID=A0A3N2DP29_9GAMM|nr:hypothetical protein EDC56_1510 [Sinobacterium caligoides]
MGVLVIPKELIQKYFHEGMSKGIRNNTIAIVINQPIYSSLITDNAQHNSEVILAISLRFYAQNEMVLRSLLAAGNASFITSNHTFLSAILIIKLLMRSL